MSEEISTPQRIGLILGALLVMTAVVYFVGGKIRAAHHDHGHGPAADAPVERLKPLDLVRQGSERPDRVSFTVAQTTAVPAGAKQRTLKDYYKLRAYPGAPPSIPHPVDLERDNSQSCNVCHEKGGFVPKYNAFTPVTPHPEYENCLQCHGIPNATDEFKASEWVKVAPPAIKRSAMGGSPPPIPHDLQYRDNCAACHTGPAAPIEIRCGHPERLNCVQCHVPQNTPSLFQRPLKEAGKQESE